MPLPFALTLLGYMYWAAFCEGFFEEPLAWDGRDNGLTEFDAEGFEGAPL